MSDNVISLRAYQKSCTRCGKQILMFPTSMNGGGTKWQALELESKESHRCINNNTNGNGNTKSSEITPQKTIQKEELAIHHTHTNDAEILALKARVAKIELWIKKFSESAMTNL